MNSLSYNEVKYVKLSPEEMKSRGILGRLKGIIADFKNPTRNGRLYTEELWDKTFKDPLIQEKVENNLMLGELGHPEQRTEIDMEKVAICLDGMPYKDKNGKVIGTFNILDTPNGRILKTLCDYGVKIGVSSRGAGDIMESYDGTEMVAPGSYSLECWDAVLVPAVKEARPQYMTESLNNDKGFKQQIRDIIKDATPNEKKVIIESLNNLKIDYKMRRIKNDSLDNKSVTESEVATNTGSAANDNGAYLVEELQRQIKENKTLKEQLQTVQEQLSVCYAKEAKYEEKLTKVNSESSLINNLRSEIKSLTEQLEQKDTQLGAQKSKYLELLESKKIQAKQSRVLNESMSNKDNEIKTLTESLVQERKKSEDAKRTLTESLEELKKDSAIKTKELNSKLNKQSSLTEHYKKIARTAVSKYISSKAEMLGVDSLQIKSKLTEGYTFEDIDRICEELQSYKANMRKLPIDLVEQKEFKFKITESKEPIKNAIPTNSNRFDDEVDDSLLRLAGLKTL